MPKWLKEKLDKAGVRDAVDPFWQSEFKTRDINSAVQQETNWQKARIIVCAGAMFGIAATYEGVF